MAPWLYEGLAKAGLPVICIEARHAHGVLGAMRANKTDKNDARGIAEIIRAGVYRTVHVKTSMQPRDRRAAHSAPASCERTVNLENGTRGLLLSAG